MHSIIFHISGIALLEICFYFYYIGPIESDMFSNNIVNLLKKSYIPYIQINSSMIKHLTYKEEELLHNDFINGKMSREEINKDLFILSIKFWFIMVCSGFVVYYIQYKYKKIRFKKCSDALISPTESGFDEIVDVSNEGSPRIIIDSFINPNNEYKTKMAYYFVFGCSVIGFEYLFFQYIVLHYSPLSVKELRYLIYEETMKKYLE
jgi:hypothetical protein